MKDYKRTEDGLYAYEYPRASVTADAVLFGYRGPRRNLQSCGGERSNRGNPFVVDKTMLRTHCDDESPLLDKRDIRLGIPFCRLLRATKNA